MSMVERLIRTSVFSTCTKQNAAKRQSAAVLCRRASLWRFVWRLIDAAKWNGLSGVQVML